MGAFLDLCEIRKHLKLWIWLDGVKVKCNQIFRLFFDYFVPVTFISIIWYSKCHKNNRFQPFLFEKSLFCNSVFFDLDTKRATVCCYKSRSQSRHHLPNGMRRSFESSTIKPAFIGRADIKVTRVKLKVDRGIETPSGHKFCIPCFKFSLKRKVARKKALVLIFPRVSTLYNNIIHERKEKGLVFHAP